MLLGAAWKRQKFSVCAIFLMIAIAALSLFTAITLYTSGTASVEDKMDRLGFGDFTVWVSAQPERLLAEIAQTADVESAIQQEIIFAGYEVNGNHSDNEGQLIADDGTIPYHFIDRSGESVNLSEIPVGSIYVSPAMESMFDVQIGDTIQFNLSRTNGRKAFTVAGYFEDAFMGSSMIDMKSFLVNSEDYEEMLQIMADAAAIDVLGRSGAMLHISKNPSSGLTDTEFYEALQEHTELARYMDFTYRKDSILSYMLLLQNIVAGFLMIFSMVLFVICLIMIRHSLTLVIQQEKGDMAILRTMGLTGNILRSIYVTLYGGSGFLGVVLGAVFCRMVAENIAKGMVTSTGMLVDIRTPAGLLFGVFAGFNGGCFHADRQNSSYRSDADATGDEKCRQSTVPFFQTLLTGSYCGQGIPGRPEQEYFALPDCNDPYCFSFCDRAYGGLAWAKRGRAHEFFQCGGA